MTDSVKQVSCPVQRRFDRTNMENMLQSDEQPLPVLRIRQTCEAVYNYSAICSPAASSSPLLLREQMTTGHRLEIAALSHEYPPFDLWED